MNRQAKLKTLSGAMLLLCAVITVTQLPSNIRYLRFACSPAGSGISVPQAVFELVFAVLFAAAFAVTGFALIKKRFDLRLISISFIASGALQLVNSAVTAAFAPPATAAAWLLAILRALLGAAGFAAVAAAARPKMRRPLSALLLSLPAALYLFTWLIQLPGTYIAVDAQYRHLMRTFVSGAAFKYSVCSPHQLPDTAGLLPCLSKSVPAPASVYTRTTASVKRRIFRCKFRLAAILRSRRSEMRPVHYTNHSPKCRSYCRIP